MYSHIRFLQMYVIGRFYLRHVFLLAVLLGGLVVTGASRATAKSHELRLLWEMSGDGTVVVNELPALQAEGDEILGTMPLQRAEAKGTVLSLTATGEVRATTQFYSEEQDSGAVGCCGQTGSRITLCGDDYVLVTRYVLGRRVDLEYRHMDGHSLWSMAGLSSSARVWPSLDGELLLLDPGENMPGWVMTKDGERVFDLPYPVERALFWRDRLLTYQRMDRINFNAIVVAEPGVPSVYSETAIVAYGLLGKELWRQDYKGHWFQPVEVAFHDSTGQTYVRLRPFTELPDPGAAEDSSMAAHLQRIREKRIKEGAIEARPARLIIIEPDGELVVERETERCHGLYLVRSGDSYYLKVYSEITKFSVKDGSVLWRHTLGERVGLCDLAGDDVTGLTALMLCGHEPAKSEEDKGTFLTEVVVLDSESDEVMRRSYEGAPPAYNMWFTGNGRHFIVELSYLGTEVFGVTKTE